MDRFDELGQQDFEDYIKWHGSSPDGYTVSERSDELRRRFAAIRRDTWNEALEMAALKVLQEHPLTDEDAIAIDERVAHIRALKVQP